MEAMNYTREKVRSGKNTCGFNGQFPTNMIGSPLIWAHVFNQHLGFGDFVGFYLAHFGSLWAF